MSNLTNKKIVLGVCGSIAAYKSADLVRRLKEMGAEVRVVMTQSAGEFITALTLQTLSHNPVHQHLLDCDSESNMSHIELARWADLVLIAPCSANFMSKLVQGMADDLLSTVCLATRAPIVYVPAMNNAMWENKATQENVTTLQQRGFVRFGPASGDQACGETGLGRMLEPVQISNQLIELFQPGLLQGKNIMITAGPTREDIDPVRFISNRSSGKMGFASAQAAMEAGANVTLVCGPVNLTTPQNINRLDVRTADEMKSVVMENISTTDIFISAAAVADYRPETIETKKIKKTASKLDLKLVRNPDIVSLVANKTSPPFTVGFAAETDNVRENALTKLSAKSLDMIAANEVGKEQGGFDSNENALTIYWQGGEQTLPMADKNTIARQLMTIIAEKFREKSSANSALT
jgi:phosphopantothenoylcysteine decarboxylase/phosphopantothenate--cysteine ligase